MAADPYNRGQAQNLVTILALDPNHGKIVAQLLEPDLLEGPLRLISERCVKFWKKYKTAPGKAHLADLFSDITDKPDSRQATAYKRILRQMTILSEEVNTEYVVRTLQNTSRIQRLKGALLKAAEVAQRPDADAADVDAVLAEIARTREFQFDPGLKLTDIDKVLDYLESHFSEFSSGVKILDDKHVNPARGDVLLFLAPTRRGKSWFLSNVAKHGLLLRKNVVLFTLEMSGEQHMLRMYQNLFGLPRHAEPIELFELDTDERGRFTGASSVTVNPKVSLDSKNLRKFLKASLATPRVKRLHNRLRIARFPPRSLTVDQMRGYLDTLEASEGFIPDMIVLDYIGIMATDVKNHRLSQGRVMEDFRAVCVERNAAGVTAAQTSKQGEKAYQVKITHVGEDWSLVQTADVALTFSQTPAERARGLARLWVDKCRNEADNWGAVITQAYAMGQFSLQGAYLGREYDAYVEGLSKRASDEQDDAEDDGD